MTGSYFYNKIILIVAFVAFLVGGFFPVGSVEAATPAPGSPAANATRNQPTQTANPANSRAAAVDAQRAAGGGADPAAAGRAETNARLQAGETRGQGGTQGSSSENGEIYCFDFGGEGLVGARFSATGCVAMGAYLILTVASWVLWLSAILFNSTINYTLNMAGFIKDIPIVVLGWTTFRDVTNLMFVFIILYIAINTIIGNEGYGIKKLLGKVIITAMLINFSLFFTQAMIDASNIFALQFYHKIIQDSSDRSEGINDLDAGISAAFVNGLGLQEVWGIGKKTAATPGAQTADINNNKELGLNAENLIIVGLGGTVLVLITAFIFFAATIMFLLRAITLIFLMILSPLAFMGGILPSLGKHTGEWWSKLMNNLLFAPVYMALLYLVIHMITKGGFKGVAGGGSFYQLFSGNQNMIGAAMTFVVLNAMMVGCLIIASKFGAVGSGWAEKTGRGFATSLGMNLSGANLGMGIARSGLGVASGIGDNRFVKKLASSDFGRVIGGAALLRGGQALKDVKVGGKSYKDELKAKEERITKEYEAIKDTNTNLVQGRYESDTKFSARKAKADALENKNQISADARVGIKVDPSTGKVTKKSFGVPSIFGGTTARYKAQKELGKKREGDVDKRLKKPYEDRIKDIKQQLKGIASANGGVVDMNTAMVTVNGQQVRASRALHDANSALKAMSGNFNTPAATP